MVVKQIVPVQFGGGINTKVDPKQLQAGQLLTLQNGQFSKTGQINKRYGYTVNSQLIEGGGSTSAGVSLATLNDQLLMFDGNNIYTYLEATGNWANRGTAISITTKDRDIKRMSSAQQLNPDGNYCKGVEAYAWEDSRGGVRYSVLDAATGAVIVNDALLNSSAQQPKVLSFTNYLVILWSDGVSNLYYNVINPNNPTAISAAVNIASDGVSQQNGFPYDATVSNGNLYVAYLNGANNVKALFLNSSFQNSGASILANMSPTGATGAISIAGVAAGNMFIAYSNGVTINAVTTASQLGAVIATFLIDTLTCANMAMIESPTPGTMLVFYQNYNATGYNTQVIYNTMSLMGTLGTKTTIRSVGLASKPFTFNNNIYVNTCYQSTLQSTDFTFLVSQNGALLSTPIIVAKETPSVGGGLQTNCMVPETFNLSYGVFKFANLIAGSIISEANTLFTLLGVNSTELIFTPSDNFVSTVQDNILLIVGGILQGYDGVSTTELGFHLYPENIVLSTEATSGGYLSAGTYQYMVQFEWTDNNGLIYRSAPSVPTSITVTANSIVNITGPTLRLTSKTTSISVVIYRTAANGSTFNQITSTLSPLLNSTTSDTWSYNDSLSDLSAQSNNLNYTTGGVLANIAPPANSIIATYGDRVFLSGMSDPLLMWYSQTVVNNSNSNTIPPQFCAELTFSIDPRGGEITALGLLNNILIIFKQNNIFALQGNGPDATGNNSDYGDAQMITSDVGCINDSSVVITPAGLMFQSSKGIYLLDQSLNVSYIGAPVEAYNTATITSAVLNYSQNQVIFTTNQSGIALVYDYYQQQWATWSNHYAVDAIIYNGTYCFLTSSGAVYQQNTSLFTDNGAPVLMSFTLPNLSFAGLQGYQRVFRAFILGSYKSAHNLIVNVAYDYNDSYSQTTTATPNNNISTWGSDSNWGSGAVWGGTSYTIYEFRIDFAIQKCTAIRLQISDSQPTGEGYAISNIIFEVGVMPMGNRLPSTATYGTS